MQEHNSKILPIIAGAKSRAGDKNASSSENRGIKVCHIITKLELGGAQQNTLFTVSNLDRNKFEPILIAGTGGILDAKAKEFKGINLYFLDNLVRDVSPIDDIKALFKIFAILSKEKPDIVHTHSSKAGILGRWAAKMAGIRTIIHTFHGFGFHDFQNHLVKSFYVFLEIICAKLSTKLIVVSNDNTDKALKLGIGKAPQYITLRSGIDTKKFKNTVVDTKTKKKQLEIDENCKVITTIGPFKPQKNMLDFIEAAKLLKAEYSGNIKFLIVGDGEQRAKIEEKISEYGLADNITLLGWRTDINEILAITDIFVLTSLWEGLPRSILEALSCGVPVVANAVDGVKEIVKDSKNGFLVEPKNPAKTAEYIIKLLSDNNLRMEFGKTAKNTITEEYDIFNMVKEQEKLYLSLST